MADKKNIEQVKDTLHYPFQTMIPRGERGFRSPQCLIKEIIVPPILKFVDSRKDMAVVGPSLVDS